MVTDMSDDPDDRIAALREMNRQQSEAYFWDVPNRTSWFVKSLAQYLNHTEPPPAFLPRTDGECLLYRGKAHSFVGASESLKTWAALLACKDFLSDRAIWTRGSAQNIMYIDAEGSPGPFVRKMLLLGVPADVLTRRIAYIRPDEPLQDSAQDDLMRAGQHYDPALIVIDGVTEFMALQNLDVNSATDVAKYQRMILRRFSGEITTIEIDHIAKSSESGVTQIGSQHKKAGIDGASYLFESRQKEGVGGISSATIKVLKDREGLVRPLTDESERIGMIVLDSRTSLTAEIRTPDSVPNTNAKESDIDLLPQVLQILADQPGIGVRPLARIIGTGDERARRLKVQAIDLI